MSVIGFRRGCEAAAPGTSRSRPSPRRKKIVASRRRRRQREAHRVVPHPRNTTGAHNAARPIRGWPQPRMHWRGDRDTGGFQRVGKKVAGHRPPRLEERIPEHLDPLGRRPSGHNISAASRPQPSPPATARAAQEPGLPHGPRLHLRTHHEQTDECIGPGQHTPRRQGSTNGGDSPGIATDLQAQGDSQRATSRFHPRVQEGYSRCHFQKLTALTFP